MPHAVRERTVAPQPAADQGSHPRTILITGGEGTLGRAFRRIAAQRGLACRAVGRGELDICNARAVNEYLEQLKPWAVINAAGYVRVDDAEADPQRCCEINVEGASLLAEECFRLGIQFATFSSDLVFDGQKGARYVESDKPRPLSVYGATKAQMEERVARLSSSLVIRTSAFFGPWDAHNFLSTTFHEVSQGRTAFVASDAVVSPTYVPDLVNATLDLIIDGERGIWHLANDGALTWHQFATLAAQRANVDSALIIGRPIRELGLRARRPANSALASARGRIMPSVENAIDRWLAAVNASPLQPKEREKTASV